MSSLHRPLVMIHGLWDNPRIFSKLINCFPQQEQLIFNPYLQHDFGRAPLRYLAEDLDSQILKELGSKQEIDLLGFSMGGVVSRIWLQQFGGVRRTKRFFSVGSPHQGSYMAHLFPSWLLEGVAQMRRNSPLLDALNSDVHSLKGVKCKSFFTRWDLMVIPGWEAILKVGSQHEISVATHQQLITHPRSLEILVHAVLSE